jgi:hypothetical protein
MELSREELHRLFEYNPVTGRLEFKSKKKPKGRAKYVHVHYAGKAYSAHRLIWILHHGPIPPGYCIDHIDRDGHNNRLSNLRMVTMSQNLQNQKYRRGMNKYGMTGVHYNANGRHHAKPWCARIGLKRRTICLGYFATLAEAIAARLQGEKFYEPIKFQGT